jgi:hypothetical protein
VAPGATSQYVHTPNETEKASFQRPGDFCTVNINLMMSIIALLQIEQRGVTLTPEEPIFSGSITKSCCCFLLYSPLC